MPRPRQHRKLKNQPEFKGFKPIGIPARKTDSIELLFDEYEVIRLLDYENLSQEEAAKKINVSRPTLTRIYQSARRKIAMALTEGLFIYFVESPHAYFIKEYFCRDCQLSFEKKSMEKPDICPTCHSKNIVEIKPGAHNNQAFRKQHRQQGLYFKPARGMGNTGYCICSQCGEKYQHIPGMPCINRKCSKCGGVLFREGGMHHKQITKKEKPDDNN